MIRMPRPMYIAYRVAEGVFLIGSQTLNALCGGSTRQRFSARCHVEQWQFRHVVNGLFFWQADHCRAAWEREIADARDVLDRAESALRR